MRGLSNKQTDDNDLTFGCGIECDADANKILFQLSSIDILVIDLNELAGPAYHVGNMFGRSFKSHLLHVCPSQAHRQLAPRVAANSPHISPYVFRVRVRDTPSICPGAQKQGQAIADLVRFIGLEQVTTPTIVPNASVNHVANKFHGCEEGFSTRD
jgi:hypothetical protein